DHPRHVGDVFHCGEGRAALEVDEHESEAVRRMADDQRADERTKHLGLTGAGRTDDQPVWPHAAMCGLLEVQYDRVAVGSDSDRDPQQIAKRAGTPGLAWF